MTIDLWASVHSKLSIPLCDFSNYGTNVGPIEGPKAEHNFHILHSVIV